MLNIIKRNGETVRFESAKILNAVSKALAETKEVPEEKIKQQAEIVTRMVLLDITEDEIPSVEEIQDLVENSLMKCGLVKTAKAYILYRDEHTRERSKKEMTMEFLEKKFMDITSKGRESSVTKGSSGNANVDTESPMGKMLSYGAEFSKEMATATLLSKEFAEAHKKGDIHIHEIIVA